MDYSHCQIMVFFLLPSKKSLTVWEQHETVLLLHSLTIANVSIYYKRQILMGQRFESLENQN